MQEDEKKSLKYRFRQIKKFPDWIYIPLAFSLMALKKLMRTEVIDPNNLIETRKEATISVTWHNRLLFFPVMFPRSQRERTMAVISASRDGQYVTDLVKQFGIGSLRGSSSRKGINALLGAVNALRAGKNVSFTPDGPRGPRYRMSMGPIYLASEHHVEIVPVAVNYSSFWALKTWDGFRIPKPWAKITLVIGDYIKIPADQTPEQMEQWRKLVEDKLNEVSQVTK